MEKIKKILFICLLIAMSFTLYRNIPEDVKGNMRSLFSANAESTVVIPNSEVNKSEEFELEVVLDNSQGVNVYKAQLEYNSDVIEDITISNFECENSWEMLKYNPSTKEFIVVNKEDASNEENVLKLTVKVKEDATEGESSIKLLNVQMADGEHEYKSSKVEAEFTVLANNNEEDPGQEENPGEEQPGEENPGEEEQPGEDNPGQEEQPGENENPGEEPPKADDVPEDKEPDNNAQVEEPAEKEDKDVPATGDINVAILSSVIAIFALGFVCSAKNIKRINKSTYIIVLLAFIVMCGNSVYAYNSASAVYDINNDGYINDRDIELLENMLIGIAEAENADINGDGEISVVDLSLLLRYRDEDFPPEDDEITVSDTSFEEYTFEQITPSNTSITFERVIMQSKRMEKYEASGAGSQWPISLEVSKDGGLMLNGTDVAGIAKSTDHGKTWRPSNIGFETRGVGMFAIDPYNNNHVLALGISKWIQNGGIYYSDDQAETWTKGFRFACRGIRYLWDGLEFDPTTYNETEGITKDVYFSTPYKRDAEMRESSVNPPECFSILEEDEVGLYKSIDGGKSFEMFINDERLADGILKITDNGKIYVGNQYGLFVVDKDNKVIEASYLENDPEVAYARGITGLDVVGNVIYAQTWDGIFTLTEDGILTKITSDDNYDINGWPQFLEVSEANPNYMTYVYRENVNNMYTNEVKISHDGGATWSKSRFIVDSSFYLLDGRNREKVFIMDPTDENTLVTFAGYNLEISKDGGLTYTQIAGISNTMQGGRFNFNFYNPNLMLFSAQDYTGVVTLDGGKYYDPLKIQGNGNIYGGFAADEKTYFGFANPTWWGGTLSVTHDGGKSWKIFDGYTVKATTGTPYYNGMQSYKDPNRLFAAQYYSKDKGYTWSEMDGCISVYAINYIGEHELYGGDEDGNLVVSYDDGDTWTILNSEPFYKEANKNILSILDIAYDHVNNIAYILLNNEKTNGGNVQKVYKYDITNDTVKEVKFPKDYYRGTMRIKTIAIDPNSVGVIYIGGSGDYYCSATGLVRSLDGGETWQVLTNAKDEHFESIATNQGGYEVTNVRVDPRNGKVWIACGCYGYETFDPPYDASELNNPWIVEHTIKYVYNDEVVKEAKVNNGVAHNFDYKVEGLEFVDWYTDKEFTNSFSNGTNVYNSMVLYAKMKPSKKLNLYVSDEIFKSIDLDKYDLSTEEFIPEREGYVFAGWYRDKALTEEVDVETLTEDATLYAGWYRAVSQIYNPNTDDMPVYIAYADHKIQINKKIDNLDHTDNRSIAIYVDKNSSYLVRFKMDTRFRIGFAKSEFWSYSTVNNYYIHEADNNGAVPFNKYVTKVVDTDIYGKMMIFYYTSTGSRDFMNIKNTMKIYKLESKELIYNI